MRRTPNPIVKSGVALLGCVIALIASGCTTDRASQPGAVIDTQRVEMGLKADVTVDMSRKLTGSARKSRLLFFTVEGPTRFAEGVFVSDKQGLLTWLFGGADDDLKAAAAYEAVYGKADVIVNPQWAITKDDYLFFAVTKVTVTGYAGTIRSYHSPFDAMKGRANAVSSDAPRAQAFANPSTPAPTPEPPALTPAPNVAAAAPETPAASVEPTSRALMPVAKDPEAKLTIIDFTSGSGSAAQAGDSVSYHYVCAVKGGAVVFDSRDQGTPRVRKAGGSEAPTGLGEGLVGARSGMHRQLVLAPSVAYGEAGLPAASIPPNATLVIDVYVDQVTPARR